MVKFKKGDRVIIREGRSLFYNEVGVIENVGLSYCGVRMDNGGYVVADPEHILYYVEVEMKVTPTPPQKIQQDGYEYKLVGPVKPDWLVDGAWVVRKDNGCKHQVVLNKNGFLVLTMPGTDTTILPTHPIYDQYRPHEPKDWKWGDWAMYAGRKVFVIEEVDWMGNIRVSHPDLPDGVDYVPVLQLTPTF